MQYPTPIARAVRSGLILSGIASTLAAPTALAQDNASPTGTADDMERIVVTGSRLKRQDMETASPVTVIEAASFRAEGYTTLDEVLQKQPSMAGLAIGSTTDARARGVAQVDLRGMGANRTLVLLNGRRMVNSGSGADDAVDLNVIPVAMVDRIEILKDGASAVYGSDAIAGVVNIITKTDFEGFNLDLNGGITEEGDGENVELSALYGVNTDGGNYTLGFSVTDRAEVEQRDRDWVVPAASSFVPGGSLGGFVPNGDGTWRPQDFGYDYTRESQLQTPSTKYSVFANMIQDLGRDITLTGDILYTHRDSDQQMAPEAPEMNLDVCGQPGVDPARCITLTEPMLGAGIAPDGDGQVNYSRRMVEAGPRMYEQETDTLRLSAGLAGYLDINTGMDWELSYTYGRNRADTYVYNAINAARMETSIYNHQDDWLNGNPDAIAPYLDDVTYKDDSEGGNDQHVVAGSITGELFDLPAGAVGFVIGAEYRYEEGYFTPDEVVQAGEGASAQQAPTDGDYHVVSVYQEIAIPFTDKLNGEFALRYDDYDTFGDSTTWKVGLTYEATDDLMLRGVVATGFRAPNISELYGGDVGSYNFLFDPWQMAPDPQILVNWTSDDDLEAEESDSLTLGLVYAPGAIDGLSFTLDYWAFDIDDAIARIDVQQGLFECAMGDVATCDALSITPDGDLSNLTNPLTNVGYQKTSGIDFNANYRFEAAGLVWTLNNDLTHLIEFEQDDVDYTGTINVMNGAYADYQNLFTMTAANDRFSLTYSNHFISEMDELYTGTEVDRAMYHNLSAMLFLNEQITLNAGVRNLTDEDPEFVPYSAAGTVTEVYESLGRTYFAGLNLRF